MAKRAFDKIAAGLRDAAAYVDGSADLARYRVHVPADIDVRAIRRALKMTQEEFAGRFGFPLSTLRDWEQGRGRPETSARAYLLVISRDAKAVADALMDAHRAGVATPRRRSARVMPLHPERN
jgi:putative transcriptional regulator